MNDPTINAVLDGDVKSIEWVGMEFTPSLIDGGGADTGGPNRLPHGRTTWVPGSSSTPAILTFNPVRRPQGQPWDNSYNYNTLTRTKLTGSYYGHQFMFALPTPKDVTNCNAVEFELELCEAGLLYNMAWQWKPSNIDGPPGWRIFDKSKEKWIAQPQIPFTAPIPGAFVEVSARFRVDRNLKQTWHDSVVIGGKYFPINASAAAPMKWSPKTWYLHHAVQPDSLGKGAPFSVLIKNWNARML